MTERGTPERRRRQRKPSERDLQPPPAWNRDEHNIFLDADGALGYVLWQRARDVRLWGAIRGPCPKLFGKPSRAQWQLHDAAVAEEPELADALGVLLLMVASPAESTREGVARACMKISSWGDARNRVEVALAYAEAAALADPACAEAAAVAGMLCLRVSPVPGGEPMDIRAAAWLRRAARLARRTKNWEWYIRAHIRLGLLLYHLAEYRAARRMYERASWMAEWYGRDELTAKAHHDLLAIEGDVGTFDAAVREAETALALYPLRNHRVPYLIHDIAFYAFVRSNHFSAARELLEAVREHIPEANRLIINGTLARVSAALRDRASYEEAASRVSLLSELCPDGATWAHIHIAEGARCFGEWDRAEAYAASALALAIRRRELDAQRTAYDLLDAIMLRSPSPREAVRTRAVDSMLATCLDRLAKLRDPDAGAVPVAQVVPTAWAP